MARNYCTAFSPTYKILWLLHIWTSLKGDASAHYIWVYRFILIHYFRVQTYTTLYCHRNRDYSPLEQTYTLRELFCQLPNGPAGRAEAGGTPKNWPQQVLSVLGTLRLSPVLQTTYSQHTSWSIKICLRTFSIHNEEMNRTPTPGP